MGFVSRPAVEATIKRVADDPLELAARAAEVEPGSKYGMRQRGSGQCLWAVIGFDRKGYR